MTDQVSDTTTDDTAPRPTTAHERAPRRGPWQRCMRVKYMWGARDEDLTLDWPCDTYVKEPHSRPFFRAVEIDAPPAVVWRWLCQTSVAPYSYDWIDNWGRQSPRELTPGAENLELGQRMVIIMELLEYIENEHMTLKICVAPKFWGDVGSTYRIVDLGNGRCRLVNKVVVHRRPGLWRAIRRSMFPWAELIMTRKQLLNMKELSEKTARGG